MTVDARGTVRLRCQSLAHRGERSAPALGDVPAGEYQFVGTAARLPDPPDGQTWIRCPDQNCRLWNCFAVGNGDGES